MALAEDLAVLLSYVDEGDEESIEDWLVGYTQMVRQRAMEDAAKVTDNVASTAEDIAWVYAADAIGRRIRRLATREGGE